ncbi:MAG: hypothetical protein KME18_19495 [Phormidium tanganyikae FI6-MK23]|nr:hypothetical protein [Phormidium tanganyikae FI6-MK23]
MKAKATTNRRAIALRYLRLLPPKSPILGDFENWNAFGSKSPTRGGFRGLPGFVIEANYLRTGMKVWRILAFGITIAANLLPISPVQAARIACPTEVEPTIQAMLRDLPGYANRIAVRSRIRNSRSSRNSVILAGRPEFTPLPLNSDRPSDPTLKQAFITTLEREIVSGKAIDIQQFHWLFLTRNLEGWQLALMFTRIGTTTPNQPITPPIESREGVIGQAVQQWLNDCNIQGIRVRR